MKIFNIDTVDEYNTAVGLQTFHPLISVIDFSTLKPKKSPKIDALKFGFYSVFFKEDQQHCTIRYGRNTYDYQKGTLIFIAPGQVVSIKEDGENYKPEGHALLFHPDLLRGTSLGHHMKDYSFFSYDVHEALHLSAIASAVCANGKVRSITGRSTPASYSAPSRRSCEPLARMKKNS